MKALNKFVFIVFSLVLTFNFSCAYAAPVKLKFDTTHYSADQFARRISKIKSKEDLIQKLNFYPEHKKQILNKLNSFNSIAPRFKIKVKGAYVYLFHSESKTRMEIDFRHLSFNKLYLNRKKINISKTTTFDQVDNQVRAALASKVVIFDFFAPRAFAQANEGLWQQYISSYFLSATSTQYMSEPVDSDGVTTAILATYQDEVNMIKNWFNRSNGYSFQTLAFECENNRLSYVVETHLVKDGRPGRMLNSDRRLSRSSDGSYEFRNGSPEVKDNYGCKAEINSDGTVEGLFGKDLQTSCPAKGTKIFEDPYFFGYFPLVADQCCQKKGCYEEVRQARSRLISDLVGTRPPGSEDSDSLIVE